MVKRLVVILPLVLMLSGIASAADPTSIPVSGEEIMVMANAMDAISRRRAAKRDAMLVERSHQQAPAVVAEPVVVIEENNPQQPPVEVSPVIETSSSQEAVATDKVWGSFPELSAWTGGWINPTAETKGVWVNLKYMQWFTKYEKPENFGLGFNVRGDYGKNGTGYDWGYFAPGPSVGYYRGLGLYNAFEADVSLLYRFDKRRDNDWMPTAHVEFSHRLDYKNRLIFQVDGNYFPNDSWIGPGIYLDHRLNEKWKFIGGFADSISWQDGRWYSGFMPSVRFKYKNRWNFGVNATLFTGLGTFYGVVVAYELTPDINTWYELKKDKSVSKKNSGDFDQDTESKVTVSEQTIDELIIDQPEEKP